MGALWRHGRMDWPMEMDMTQATQIRILPDLQQQASMDLQAEIAKLRAENATLKAKDKGCSLKITDKGGLSMYGLGRFPVTLYRSQWLKLLAQAEIVKAFIEEAGDKLTSKD